MSFLCVLTPTDRFIMRDTRVVRSLFPGNLKINMLTSETEKKEHRPSWPFFVCALNQTEKIKKISKSLRHTLSYYQD